MPPRRRGVCPFKSGSDGRIRLLLPHTLPKTLTTEVKHMTSKLKIRRPYDASAKSSIEFPQTTMTKQSFQDECDINTIMSKYQRTGLIEHVSNIQGAYGDFTNVQEYQLSLNQVIAAQEAFDQLPATMRERFANDPGRLMSFLEDDRNRDEAIKLGLVAAPAPEPEKKSEKGAAPPSPPPSEEKPA